MRRLALVLALALALPLGEGLTAHAASSFTFHGSGFGHGLGMSQFGTLGLAERGWSPGRILRHYYRGAGLEQRGAPVKNVRVGLLQSRGTFGLAAVGGSYDLVLQSGRVVDTVPAGAHRTIDVVNGGYRVTRPNGSVIGNRTWGGAGNDLLAKPSGGRIWVWHWEHHLKRGRLRFRLASQGSAHLVAVVNPEQYVYGVAEVPNQWNVKALRTQAIASRTFLYWRVVRPRSGCWCHILPSTSDQHWTGADKETSSGGDRWVRAVRDTKKKVVVHGGEPIYAVYGSSSGGHTDVPQVVWPNGSALPYLKPVCDPAEWSVNTQNRAWKVTVDAGVVTSKLRPYTGNIGTVKRFTDYSLGKSGRVRTVRVVGSNGSATMYGWDVRGALGLKDSRFYVGENRNVTGRIRGLYDRRNCKPGRATTGRRSVNGGVWQRFENGRIYQHNGRKVALWLRGRTLTTYLGAGGPGGRLGLPYRDRVRSGVRTTWFDGGRIVCKPGCRVRYS